VVALLILLNVTESYVEQYGARECCKRQRRSTPELLCAEFYAGTSRNRVPFRCRAGGGSGMPAIQSTRVRSSVFSGHVAESVLELDNRGQRRIPCFGCDLALSSKVSASAALDRVASPAVPSRTRTVVQVMVKPSGSVSAAFASKSRVEPSRGPFSGKSLRVLRGLAARSSSH
jgi:hypothetical protein